MPESITLTSFMDRLYWREPMWLLLCFQPLLVYVIIYQKNKIKLLNYVDESLQPWVIVRGRFSWKSCLISRSSLNVILWFMFSLSAAGPRLLNTDVEELFDHNTDVVLIFDISRSMLVKDIKPNRLRRGELEINELVNHLHGQRLGIILYAGRPHVFIPLTWDKKAIMYYLRSIEKIELPTHGSQLVEALHLAIEELNNIGTNSNKSIIVISDGDITEDESNVEIIANTLNSLKISVHVMAVGTEDGGPIPNEEGGWLTYQGKPVISRLNETKLRNLSNLTGGKYTIAKSDNSDWIELFDKGVMAGKRNENGDENRLWIELYPWLLLPGMVLIILLIIPYDFKQKNYLSLIILIFVAAGLSHSTNLYAEDISDDSILHINNVSDAYTAYKLKDYTLAAELYGRLSGFDGLYGAASSYYNMGKFKLAKRLFSEAILIAESDKLRANSIFNLGNSLFKLGDYKKASLTFMDVLRYEKDHIAAKNNLALSDYLLEQITSLTVVQNERISSVQGPGKAGAFQDSNVSNAISISADEMTNKIIIPKLPSNEKQKEWIDMIKNGLRYITITEKGMAEKQTITRKQNIAMARLYMERLDDQSAKLWLQLFEREEGFTARQNRAVELPNIKPW